MKEYKMLINGQWRDSSAGNTFLSYNPSNQEAWAKVPQATEDDVKDAVEAANSAYNTKWRETNGATRANLLLKLADLLDENAEELGFLESTDNGKLLRESINKMHFAAKNYRFAAAYADKLYGEVIPLDNSNVFDYTKREPIGTVVLITAWNGPISNLSNKLAPALAAGNTVVIKPSEHTSVSTLVFGRLIQEAGFPDGVVNIVTGDAKVGDCLTKCQNIGKISFTGGSETGRIIARNASENLVKVTLELGGKSPHLIFADANLKIAIPAAVGGIYGSTGQTCIAGSRLLVERPIFNEVVDGIIEIAKKIRIGNPFDSETDMGPVAIAQHYERILTAIDMGVSEGAKIAYGGKKVQDGELTNGLYIEPTLLVNVTNDMKIAQEEVFGPVLCVIPFDDEEEAFEIANDTKYGLASGIWTKDLARAHRFSNKINAGTVWVNTYRKNTTHTPFGGVKQSGYGRERGIHGILEYTQIKNVMIDYNN